MNQPVALLIHFYWYKLQGFSQNMVETKCDQKIWNRNKIDYEIDKNNRNHGGLIECVFKN